jgi:hypothetical protein
MQLDFHHAVTFVLARIAGLSSDEARVVAYCSQYVDDAVEAGQITFDNGAKTSRISSAHRALNYHNMQELAGHLVWLPFHFLPGNMGLPAGEEPDGPFINKLIAIPNSAVAQDMVRAAIEARRRPYGLHRLGVTMHVYADTWAHQGFAGVNHIVNQASDLTGPDGKPDELLANRVKNYFLNNAMPLGHGTVLTNPDHPYLVWAYTNGLGERITRNNPDDYLDAAENMCRAMQRFVAGDPDFEAPGLPSDDYTIIQQMLREVTHPLAADRHATWCYQIGQGTFSFGPEELSYAGEGPGSWEHEALQGASASGVVPYPPSFLASNWKLAHDALQSHRFDIVHDILPRYGISTA